MNYRRVILPLGAVLAVIFLCLCTSPPVRSFVTGSGVMALSYATLFWSWRNTLAKKNLVLSVGVIVIKYAILGLFIFVIIHRSWVDPGWFLAGISMLFPALGWVTLRRLKE